MYNFPGRSWQSDLHAKYVRQALDRAGAGENFMVSVVTTQSGIIYVAISGSTRAALENQLEPQLSFANSLDEFKLNKKQKGDLDRAKRGGDVGARHQLELDKSVRKLAPKPGGIYRVVRQLSQMHGSLTDPQRVSVRDRVRAYEAMIRGEKVGQPAGMPAMGASLSTNPLNFQGNRDCAEPKVLEGVYRAGERPTGMTTIWYGRAANPYPAPGANPLLNLARPCEFCQMNEQRIMLHIMRL